VSRFRSILGVLVACGLVVAHGAFVRAQEPPALTEPVNDFAGLLPIEARTRIDSRIRALQRASGDVVVVATVDTIAPYADIREYAVRMFANQGRGIGERDRDNGLLLLVAVQERQVRIEVGYGLEQFVTDGFAGDTVRRIIAPRFRAGDYATGLEEGAARIVDRIARGRNVVLQGVPATEDNPPAAGSGRQLILALFILFLLVNALAGRPRRRRRWAGGSWSGWHSGVGPFGGPFGGGFGGFGGGHGGGFGGFGGGRSGGGGGGGSW